MVVNEEQAQIKEAILILRQVMDRAVVKGGIFNNINEVVKANDSIVLIERHIDHLSE